MGNDTSHKIPLAKSGDACVARSSSSRLSVQRGLKSPASLVYQALLCEPDASALGESSGKHFISSILKGMISLETVQTVAISEVFAIGVENEAGIDMLLGEDCLF